MHRHIRDEWTKRLRSGEYEQGTGKLNVDDKFCCWGVLCEIAAEQNVVVKEQEGPVVSYNGYWILPGPEVHQWAGIDDAHFEMHHREGMKLYDLNDRGTPFPEIAHIIEQRF